MNTLDHAYLPLRRRWLIMVTAVGLVAASCGDSSGNDSAGDEASDDLPWDNVVVGPEASDDEPVGGGSVVVAMGSEPATLSPPNWQAVDYNVAHAVFDPLVARAADGSLQPYLAESIEPNDDLDEWTLTLRPDVRFHDGTSLDAEALKRIWDDHVVEGTSTGQISDYVDGLEVDDDLTVTYVLSQPHGQFPEVLTLPMGWPFSPDAADELGDDFGDQPVGTGPFELVSWQRDNEMVLERNEDYWQEGLPYLDEVTFRHIPDETTRAQTLESGAVDVAQASQQSPLAMDVANIDGVRVAVGETNNGRGMMFNTAEPPTDDQRVRQALAHAVDQDALLPVALGDAAPLSEVRTQFFPSDSPFYSDAVADAWPTYDLDEALRLHDDYANDPDRSDGLEVGEPVELTLTTSTRAVAEELTRAYADAYEDAGFEVAVETIAPTDVSGTALSGSYEAFSFGLGADRPPLGELELYFGSPDLPSNFTNFHDEVIDEVIGELRITDDVDRQAELAEEMGLHLAEQMSFHWLANAVTFFAADEAVRGLDSWELPDGTLGSGTSRAQTMWGHVWLES